HSIQCGYDRPFVERYRLVNPGRFRRQQLRARGRGLQMNKYCRFACRLILLFAFAASVAWAERVPIVYDADVPQAAYAARKLKEALTARGHEVTPERHKYDYLISLATHPARYGAEAFAIIPESKVITIYGGDARGLIYGALELAEAVRNG